MEKSVVTPTDVAIEAKAWRTTLFPGGDVTPLLE